MKNPKPSPIQSDVAQSSNDQSRITPSRRGFLQVAAVAATAVSMPAAAYGRIMGANEQIRCGVIGLNGRGQDHIRGLRDHVTALCDCDSKILERRTGEVAKKLKRPVTAYNDYRKLLDDKNVDAVSIATPNHLHSLMGVEAIVAGKHVYCEKPVSHNVWEGRQLVNAQVKFGRVVQCGTQSRSSPSLQAAVKYVRDGELGKILYAIGTCYKPRKSIGKRDQPLAIPDSVDYELWCGPAEKRPLYRSQLHYDWHWDFNTGNGDMGNQGIHQMDIARWFLGYDQISPRVLSIGGRLGYDDAGDTPNTQTVIHDYGDAPLIFETRGLPKSLANQTGDGDEGWARNMDNYRGSQIGVIVQCENGYVVIPNYTSAKAIDAGGKEIKSWNGGGNHYQNFLDAVAANEPSQLNGPIVEGHLSSALCHTGGVSHQLGERVPLAEIESAIESESELFRDSVRRMVKHLQDNGVDVGAGAAVTLGANLEFDATQEVVTNNERGNAMMARDYRAGFELPKLEMKAAS